MAEAYIRDIRESLEQMNIGITNNDTSRLPLLPFFGNNEQEGSTINMTRVGKEQTNKYFRDESLHPSAFEGENAGEIYSSQQHCQINNNAEQDESDISKTKDNQEVRRCTIYMSGLKCHKGDYCEKSHRFPREDKVLCEYFDGEGCDRPASECWYWHPGTSIKYVPDDNAPLIVQSMGGIMKYLKEKTVKNVATLKFKGSCHLCGMKGHKAVDCLNSGRHQHLRPAMHVRPTSTAAGPQKFERKCTWCNNNHSSYECNFYDKVGNHVMNKNMRSYVQEKIPNRVGGYNNRGNRGYSARGYPARGYSVRGYPNRGYSGRGYQNRGSRGASNRGQYSGRGRGYQTRARGGHSTRVFNATSTDPRGKGDEEDNPVDASQAAGENTIAFKVKGCFTCK